MMRTCPPDLQQKQRGKEEDPRTRIILVKSHKLLRISKGSLIVPAGKKKVTVHIFSEKEAGGGSSTEGDIL